MPLYEPSASCRTREEAATLIGQREQREMITISQQIEPGTRSREKGPFWLASTMIDGQVYTARSRNGAPNALARKLVEAGIADQPYQIMSERDPERAGVRGRSFMALCGWTYTEGATSPLRRIKWVPLTEKWGTVDE